MMRRLLLSVSPVTACFTGLAAVVVAVSLLSACAADTPLAGTSSGRQWYEPYRMEIVQGNVVTKEMAEQLRPGLTRDQVKGVLGSPLLTDIFHADRWDYVFTIRRQGTEPQQRRLTVTFKGDRMNGFEAGDLPSERDFVASIDVRKSTPASPPLELTEEQLRTVPLPAARATTAGTAASGPARTYPSLEPVGR